MITKFIDYSFSKMSRPLVSPQNVRSPLPSLISPQIISNRPSIGGLSPMTSPISAFGRSPGQFPSQSSLQSPGQSPIPTKALPTQAVRYPGQPKIREGYTNEYQPSILPTESIKINLRGQVSYPQSSSKVNIIQYSKSQIDEEFIQSLDFSRIRAGKVSRNNPSYTVSELQGIARRLFLPTSASKSELVESIINRLQQFGYLVPE